MVLYLQSNSKYIIIFIRMGARKDVTTKKWDFIVVGAAEKCTNFSSMFKETFRIIMFGDKI